MAGLLQHKARSALAELPDRGEMQAEIRDLRAQIERLAGRAASRSGRELRRLSAEAGDRAGGWLEEGEALFGDVGRELRHVERRATATVRARPVESAALALGLGLAVVWLLRR